MKTVAILVSLVIAMTVIVLNTPKFEEKKEVIAMGIRG